MSAIRAWLPAPLLSISLLLVWLMLARTVSLGQLLLGLGLALSTPLIASKLRLQAVRVRQPDVLLRFVLRVMSDVVVSNFAVGRDVFRWRWRTPRSRFVIIPLDLRHPAGLASLAVVTTIVPGTVWSELAVDRSALLLHVWDVEDEAAFIARFKARYEQPLRAIFE
jgi:multicomponent K+:H+ antiporter subunit E